VCVYNIPGDNIAVYPTHSEATVARAAAAFGLAGRLLEVFTFDSTLDNTSSAAMMTSSRELSKLPFPVPTTVEFALKRFLAVGSTPSMSQLRVLASYLPPNSLLPALLQDTSATSISTFRIREDNINWVILFECFPELRSAVPTEVLFQLIQPLTPR